MSAVEPEDCGDGEAARAHRILSVSNLTKTRQQGGISFELKVPALSLRAGELIAVVGESGCGKSTLLDLLALVSCPSSCDGFLFQTQGGAGGSDIAALWKAGRESTLARLRRQHLGYVLQTGGLLPFLTVRQNLELPLHIQGLQVDPIRLNELASRIGVADLMGKKPQFLSGGQRQRVAILRALVHSPTLVLADEPTAAVDRTRARRIVADFRSLAWDGGCTIVMVTHDQPLVDGVADRQFGFRLEQVSENLTRSICLEGEV
ncbi:hypothetical protein CKO25_17965 [Thiocapsa imhoffii]|uniref:ABC transporter domain-containing protein n=1 Tax=Thiocapsa imhoffii TaxID=382777 RepID=A0A9X0WKM0_9GAMM|nr:ATP-binding cassette domain-containing protein [Thiocapsa imhoffii]MBK1646497.1 hypothetical protein [Thiocapsa imhoffii]